MTNKNVKYTIVKTTNDNSDDEGEFLNFQNEIELTNGKDDISTVIPSPSSSNSSNSCQTILYTTVLISSYFVLSIGVTFYQRMILKEHHFPFSIVIYHLIIKLLMSYIVRVFYQLFTGKSRVKISLKTSFTKVAPTSFFGAIDIGFSQKGLQFFGVALYTMTKSTAIIFISMFAILFKLEKKSWSLLAIVCMISSGLFLFTYDSKEFQFLGFIFLLIASFSSGGRWTLAQLLMQKSKLGLHNPIDMIYYMQGYMIVSLLPFALLFEGKSLWISSIELNNMDNFSIFMLWFKISVGAFLIFFMEINEFLVLSKTSSLTLSIAGVFKEICQLVLAVEKTGQVLSFANIIGLLLCLGGIACHVLHKYLLLIKSDRNSIKSNNESKNRNSIVSTSSSGDVENDASNTKKPHKIQNTLMESESDSDDGIGIGRSSDVLFHKAKFTDEKKHFK